MNNKIVQICVLLQLLFINVCDLQTTQPNIVIILADDVGWNDFSIHGSNQIPTPNIDALAYNGIILNKFYTQQTCTPSRTALLTGQYPIRSGMQGMPLSAGDTRALPTDIPTLPEKLKELGYSTHLVGKWHLGGSCQNVTPTRRGFDSHYGYWHGFIGYFNHMSNNDEDMVGLDFHDAFDAVWTKQGQYATTVFTEKATEIIQNHDNKNPLFLFVSQLAAHSGKNGTDLEVPDIADTNRTFDYIKDMQRRMYADMVHQLDISVGEIMSALSDANILNNTIVLFLSDNGGETIGPHANFGSNWPLRGLKYTLYEGGVRNTAIVYYSKFLNKGVANNELIHISDWMPTFYAVAGGDLQDLGKIDGINQWQTLTENKTTERTEILLNIDEKCQSSGLIAFSGRYKLVNDSCFTNDYTAHIGESGRTNENPEYNLTAIIQSKTNKAIQKLNSSDISVRAIRNIREKLDLKTCRNQEIVHNVSCVNLCLFDLTTDPCETTDISVENPIILHEMSAKLQQYWAELVPQQVKFIDPLSNPKFYNNTWTAWLGESCQRRGFL